MDETYYGLNFVFPSNLCDYQPILHKWAVEAKRRKGIPHTIMPTRTDHKSQKHTGIMTFLSEEMPLPR